MKKHSTIGVLSLVILMAAVVTLNAGEGTVYYGANGECCVLVDGACVPCDGNTSGTSTTALATPATATLANAKIRPATAPAGGPYTLEQCKTLGISAQGCGSGPCEPMTPDQCRAMGIDPSQCGPAGAGGKLIGAKSQLASGCAPGPGCVPGQDCAPSPGCGTASSCGTGGAGMTLVGVRNANTGAVTYLAVPISVAKNLMAKSRARQNATLASANTSTDTGI